MNQTSPVPKRRAKALPIAITLLCGILLAGGSCFGFLSTINKGSGGISNLFAVGFFAGVLLVIGAAIWGIVAIILYAMDKPSYK